MKKPTVTVLIPCYNEAAVLPKLYRRLASLAQRQKTERITFLFINDGSRDHTLETIKKYAATDRRVGYIDLSRNYGKEIALTAGIDHANGDAVVLVDADLQDPPELIPKMI
ncbi:MAG: glycosyltransferase, partial [Candidatus Nomurabacteria bacterium]|nr:glycosyltransferase [Candidatus Nomurabacteria bacterium]